MSEQEQQPLQYDGDITISVGNSRHAKEWQNRTLSWSEFVRRLSRTNRTGENMVEYLALPKTRQDDIKDVGGFVGGSLKDGRRVAANVQFRQVLTLDADFASADFWTVAVAKLGCAACVYSTHKHKPETPRLRLVIPLARPAEPEEYLAIGKRIAADIGIDAFDDTTYEPSRLMYWPSTPSDGEFVFEVNDAPWLDPDKTLARYDDWRDASQWPESSRSRDNRHKKAAKQGDPLGKTSLVGTFCRAYSIPDAIATFLPEVYEPCGEGRFTYINGSSAGGLVLYEDKFAFSHHGTDPISGMLVNAFDLVRVHKFGMQDEDAATGTPMLKLPSYASMLEFVGTDDNVKELVVREKQDASRAQLTEEGADDTHWPKLLELGKSGQCRQTTDNAVIILEHDPALAKKIRVNDFLQQLEVTAPLPWREAPGPWSDTDDAALRHYLEKIYGLFNVGKISDALSVVADRIHYHPVREYLSQLDWDGLPRLETVLIDYLNAADTEYTRAVTRKFFAAAAARIFAPGIKYDYMLTLVGPQGIGKSELIKRLARDWHSDSFSTVQGKEAYEQLQGAWIIEMAELTATKKAEVEAVKHFISKREDVYRVAYGRRVSHFPRQCVFVGTTNDPECLKDKTGNRRFWTVDCRTGARRSIWERLDETEIDQIWAEAVDLWRSGEALFLDGERANDALRQQESHMEENPLHGMIEDYLQRRLPLDWYDRNSAARRAYIHKRGDFGAEEPKDYALTRTRVCAMEIWVELLEGEPKNLQPMMSRQILEALRKIPGWNPAGPRKFSEPYGSQRAYEITKMD